MKFLIDNILLISLIFALAIQIICWIIDKIKIKKDIKELEESIKSLRKTNHNILNTINKINIKLAIDENNNKTD